MSLKVAERAQRIATYRFIEVRLMEIVAAWTPTTPEMEIKVLFGRHIWDFAQHADRLGKRTFELRQPEQHSVPPADAYLASLKNLAEVPETAARLDRLYTVMLPSLDREYASYLKETDPLLDAPSVVIVEQIRRDLERMQTEQRAVRKSLQLKVDLPQRHDDPPMLFAAR